MTPAFDEAQRLLRLAQRDSATFDLLRPLPQADMAAVGFHAQQAVENGLKSVCMLHGIEVRRTHDLTALAQSLVDAGHRVPISMDGLRMLNPFAVEFRYDDEFTTLLSQDDLVQTVATIMHWVRHEIANPN